MHKMMIAATFLFAACGTANEGMEPAGDAGVGSGSDAGPDGTCTKAADCAAGEACNLVTQECVAGALTIEPTEDVVVDGARWWTAISDPEVRGTFDGVPGATVHVTAGGMPPIAATLEGNTWSAKLPTGAIASTDTLIEVVMTDPSEGQLAVQQVFVLDTLAPQIGLATSKIRDERGDTIDFSTGEPIHTHAGTEIDLAAGGCPAVFKHPYLMDATPPVFGSATSPNPLAWNVTIADAKLDPSTKLFRVRTDASAVLLPWTALPAPDGAGVHRVELNRAGGAYPIAQLGTRTGKLYLDVRARDWNGLEATQSFCIDYTPLAAPLQVTGVQQDELFGMTLPGDAPVSKIINFDDKVGVVSQRIVQHAAEPVTVRFSATGGAAQYTRRMFSGTVAETADTFFACPPGSTDPRCQMATDPTLAPMQTNTGTFTPGFAAALVDEASGEVVATSNNATVTWTIPARAASSTPRGYRVVLRSNGWNALAVGGLFFLDAEHALIGRTYTGVAATAGVERCAEIAYYNEWGNICVRTKKLWSYTALDHARVELAPFTTQLRTSTDPAATGTLAKTTTSSALVWDAGDDVLPGVP